MKQNQTMDKFEMQQHDQFDG